MYYKQSKWFNFWNKRPFFVFWTLKWPKTDLDISEKLQFLMKSPKCRPISEIGHFGSKIGHFGSKNGHFGSKLPIYHWGATVCVNFWIKITQKFQSWHDLEILEAAQLSIWNWLSRIGNVKTKDAVIEIISRLLYRILNRHNLQKRSNHVIKGTASGLMLAPYISMKEDKSVFWVFLLQRKSYLVSFERLYHLYPFIYPKYKHNKSIKAEQIPYFSFFIEMKFPVLSVVHKCQKFHSKNGHSNRKRTISVGNGSISVRNGAISLRKDSIFV